ncbi:AMP-binding protein [Bradyrhizobium liaoningense]|uniref:AMP-binding protein n=1 Tax=Bradyrhizobium liaoningense TaxID=43992 RepID=UPI001BAA3DBD|nr:AMP-binding protein [Bradyrhizobium liaoningense]MBR0857723.1 AMP-binding protein [Bradyrhizobium liaoningense]
MRRAEPATDYTRSEESYLLHVRALQAALWPVGVPKEPVFPHGRQPLTHYLREWARRQPDKPAVLFYGRSTTYAELDRFSDRFASLLKRLGAGKGDRVAVFLPNCPQFHICFFGILKAGCVHVPVNPMFTRPELAYEISDTQARIVVAHDQLAHLVEEVRAECGIEHLVVTSFGDALGAEPERPLPPTLTEPRVPVARSIDLMSALEEEVGPAPQVDVAIDDIAALNYTGGTTGMPKGCLHTQFDMLFTGAVMGSVSMTVTSDDVIINFWPIFWMAGEDLGIVLPMVTGATCVLMARWDPVAYMQAVQRHRASISNMVVDNAVEIMDRPDARHYDMSSLREVMVASFVKKLNPAFRDGWRRLTGTVLREAAWGMTETHSYDAFNRGWQDDDRDLNQRQIFCGIPVPETDFKILEFGSDKLVPLGEEGELCVRTPSMLKGYWNKPSATAQVLQNGWLRTGDIGMISEQGTIHFLGRRKEMLKVKGMSVFPSEIEAVLGQHPDVTGSGVIGRADEARGQVPVAFVTISREQNTTAETLATFCRERLAVYKIPEIRIVDVLPMTATGKVKKEELSKLCG